MLNAIRDSKEAEILYDRAKKDIPIIDKDNVMLQEGVLLYPKHIQLKLRRGDELKPNKRSTMVGLYLQCMYLANAPAFKQKGKRCDQWNKEVASKITGYTAAIATKQRHCY